MEWLAGTVALVTGAGSGIGAAVVRRFVAEGARVVAFDRSAERIEDLCAELGDGVAAVTGDVRSFADNERATQTALDRFGALDVFVGNAGVWDGKRTLTEMSPDELGAGFDEVFSINVRGYLLGAKASAPALRRARGAMIFTLSTSSYYVGGGGLIYIAAKHATLGIVARARPRTRPGDSRQRRRAVRERPPTWPMPAAWRARPRANRAGPRAAARAPCSRSR